MNIQENIKAIREETWEAIHRDILSYAIREKVEKGRTVRVDSPAVETDIHHPTDSTLLADGVRIITRWLTEGKELTPRPDYQFSDHQRVVKKRVMTILNARKDTVKPTGTFSIMPGWSKAMPLRQSPSSPRMKVMISPTLSRDMSLPGSLSGPSASWAK